MTTSFADNAINVPESGTSARGKYPNFWRYPNFLITQCGIDGRKLPDQKPARFVQSVDTIPAYDRQTYDNSIYCASIASHVKKYNSHIMKFP